MKNNHFFLDVFVLVVSTHALIHLSGRARICDGTMSHMWIRSRIWDRDKTVIVTYQRSRLFFTFLFIPLSNRVRGPYLQLRTEFFPLRFMACALRAWAIYISTVCLTGSGTISIHAERLQISDAPQKQNESI